MKSILLALLLIAGLDQALGQHENLPAVDLADADSLLKVAPKPFLLLMEADWCKFCLAMKAYLSEDGALKRQVSDQYYFSIFNPYDRAIVQLFDSSFYYVSSGPQSGYHELQTWLEQQSQKNGLPGLFLFSPQGQLLFSHSGFLSQQEMMEVLNYFTSK